MDWFSSKFAELQNMNLDVEIPRFTANIQIIL